MSYCLLDAARMAEALDQAKELAGEAHYVCLYKGQSATRLNYVAPYLFINRPPQFTEWLFSAGWGQSWGIYVVSEATPEAMQKHFRRFLMVKADDGKLLYFRFYDPRVLRQFLPTCTHEQLTDFFGPIRYFLIEDKDPDFATTYSVEQGSLSTRRFSRSEAELAYTKYLNTF